MCVCRHPHSKYASNFSFSLHRVIFRFRITLEILAASEMTVVHEVHPLDAVKQRSIENVLTSTKPESIMSYGSNDIEQSEALCAVLDRAILITDHLELVQSGMLGNLSNCFTAMTSIVKHFETSRRP